MKMKDFYHMILDYVVAQKEKHKVEDDYHMDALEEWLMNLVDLEETREKHKEKYGEDPGEK